MWALDAVLAPFEHGMGRGWKEVSLVFLNGGGEGILQNVLRCLASLMLALRCAPRKGCDHEAASSYPYEGKPFHPSSGPLTMEHN